MGKFLNTSQKVTINSLVDGFKDRMNNPYYKFTDKKPTIVTYYNINKAKSTLDESLKIEYSRLGDQSPLRFNKINNFFIYGVEKIMTELELGDFGLEGSAIEGDALILPNTIEPLPNDYFVINHIKDTLLFKVTSVTMDTIENDNNFWKITYKLDRPSSDDIEDQIIETYEMILDNVGTQMKSIVKQTDCNFIGNLDNILLRIKEYYNGLFYNDRVQTYSFNYKGKNFYDPYMIEFMIRHKLFTSDDDYLYINHMTSLDKTFVLEYDKTIFRLLEIPDVNKKQPRYTSQANYIDEIMSIFDSRPEEYFQIHYIDNKSLINFNEYIIENFSPELIYNIFNDKRFSENDYRNIIVGFFYNEKINGDMLEILENIEFEPSMELFYNIPVLIYVLENNILDLLKTYK